MCLFLTGISCFLKKVLSTFFRSKKFKSWYACIQAFEFIRSAKGHQLNIQKHEILQKVWKIACDLGFAATNCSCQKMSKINSDICWGGRAGCWWLADVCSIFIFCVWRLPYFYFLRSASTIFVFAYGVYNIFIFCVYNIIIVYFYSAVFIICYYCSIKQCPVSLAQKLELWIIINLPPSRTLSLG